MWAPTSPGDVLDRITILTLKRDRLADPAKVAVAERHLALLEGAWAAAALPSQLPESSKLAAVNAALWDVEDALRDHEAREDFGEAFVALARSVYRLNDERAALKASIDRRLGAAIHDVKSYTT